MNRLLFRMLFLIVVSLGLYGYGAFRFMEKIPQSLEDETLIHRLENIEALVVFTGGSKRIDLAKSLVESGFDGPVLITGVDKMVSEDALLSSIAEEIRPSFSLDYTALSTKENALVTKRWMAEKGLEKMGLITSSYHMPRSLMLMAHEAPEIEVLSLPVFPDYLPNSFLFREYNKYLFSHFEGL